MSTYGIIFTAFSLADTLADSLAPWLVAREKRYGDHRWLIAAVSVPFKGFDAQPDDGTRYALTKAREEGEIDHLITGDQPMTETEARGAALQWLVETGADTLLQVDADEIYSLDEIQRIVAFWDARPHIACARGSLRNYVFDDRTYLTQPFTPMRLHRVRVSGYQAHSFWDDNNVTYGGTITRDLKRDIDFPCVTIPKAVCWAKHFSWPNSIRSQRKIRYQLEGRGWPTCSFDWDDARGGLIWRDGVSPPETARDPV